VNKEQEIVMHIKTSVDRAGQLVLTIPHKSCAKAIVEHWRVAPDGTIRAQSVYWLYCWAKTGMNSEEARHQATQVFDEILPVSFADFDAVVDHACARDLRYASRDVEDELETVMSRLSRAGEPI
jgi:hypothetical protein